MNVYLEECRFVTPLCQVSVTALKEVLQATLTETFSQPPASGQMAYDGDKCNALSKSLADTIRSRLKQLPFPVRLHSPAK